MTRTLHGRFEKEGLLLSGDGIAVEELYECVERLAGPRVGALTAESFERGLLISSETIPAFLQCIASVSQCLPDACAGQDLFFWADVLRYAGAVAARGFYLPILRRADGQTYEGRWLMMPDLSERQNISGLFNSRPLCLSDLTLQGFYEVLNFLLDGSVRSSGETLLSRVHSEKGKCYSAHDAWVVALRGGNPVVQWNAAELSILETELAAWRFPVEDGLRSDIRAAFRLSEPESPEADWKVNFGWMDDVRLRPVAEAEPGEKRALLTSLAQAALLFPALAEVRDSEGFTLNTSDAFFFLRHTSRVLRTAGYKVLLPEQLSRSGLRLYANAETEDDKEPGLNSPVRLSWHVSLGDQDVLPEQLEEFVRTGVPIVWLQGHWHELNLEQAGEVLRRIRKTPVETRTVAETLKLSIGIGKGPGDLPVDRVLSAGWLTQFIDRLKGGRSLEPLVAPEGFNGVLRPYQERGFGWMAFLRQWGFGACLADDMGLGKTIQALALILKVKLEGCRSPILLTAPLSVLSNWQREIQKFTPGLRIYIHHGPDRLQGAKFAALDADIVLTSYHLLYRDYEQLRRIKWSGIILDEAQNIKNPMSRQSRAARALEAEYRIALTGTPLENHVGDLWAVMDFLNPGLLGSRADFRETFFHPIQFGFDAGARERLARITEPFLLRRLKSDKQIISDLPKKSENKVYCMLTREQSMLYSEVLEQFNRDLETADGPSRRGLILAVLTRLKQVCNHPLHYTGADGLLSGRSGKMTRLEEMLAECAEAGDSALIFTQYAQMGKLLQRRLSAVLGEEVPFLHGGLTAKARTTLVEDYQEGRGSGIFILSLKAGGYGLNLTRANRVFHFDRWWNPAVEAQATDRVFRIGQIKDVMVHAFICRGTLEERIDDILMQKKDLADQIVRGGEAGLMNLTNDELRNVLALAADRIDE